MEKEEGKRRVIAINWQFFINPKASEKNRAGEQEEAASGHKYVNFTGENFTLVSTHSLPLTRLCVAIQFCFTLQFEGLLGVSPS